jgi:hypothetical protein
MSCIPSRFARAPVKVWVSINPRSSDRHFRPWRITVTRHIQRSLLIALFLFPLAVRAADTAEDLRPANLVRLKVDPDKVRASIADDFIGFGYETSAVARQGFFSADNKHMVQLYRTLSTSGLVRIGGIIGDHTRFEPEAQPVAHAMNETTVINNAVLADLAGFLRATGWTALWTLNLGTGTKEEAVQEALAVRAALGDRLHSFEIGNEVDLLKRFDSYAAYHAAYLEYKAAIRAAIPDAVFSGPDSAAKKEWTVAFAKTESKDMKLLLHHYYRGGAKSPQATIETLLGPHPEWNATLRTLEGTCKAEHIAFRINEVNSFSGGGKPDVSDTFASALWCLDFMFRVAAHGGVGVNMETDVNQLGFVSHYSPIYRGDDGQLTARPEYYGMLAFALAGKGKLVEVTTSPTSINMSAYATKSDDGPIWVTVINKDLAQSASIELALPQGYSTAECYRLTAPSAQSKTGVTLAGAQVTSEGTWSPRSAEVVPVSENTAMFTLPAASAALVRLR